MSKERHPLSGLPRKGRTHAALLIMALWLAGSAHAEALTLACKHDSDELPWSFVIDEAGRTVADGDGHNYRILTMDDNRFGFERTDIFGVVQFFSIDRITGSFSLVETFKTGRKLVRHGACKAASRRF